MLLALLTACGQKQPDYCVERNRLADLADEQGVTGYPHDADCDGTPDYLEPDHCLRSPVGDPTDRLGCTSGQASGCWLLPEAPAEDLKAEGEVAFRWSGDCDVYLVQFSDDLEFHPARTRTAVRTEGREVHLEASEAYWRLVGGLEGESAETASAPRSIRWR